MYMEYIVVKPKYRDYWNNEGSDFVAYTPGFRNVMTRDRFLAIWSFLHVVDENDPTIDKTDKIYKMRPMLTGLLAKFVFFYNPKMYLSLDEGMIPTKNRLAIKQYIKSKPTKWGIKSFMLCEGDTGYIINAEIYTGKAEMPEKILGAVGNTVVRLLTSCELDNKAHVLVMDRYYNSVTLADYLLNVLHTCVVGTVMINRKHFPKSLKVKALPKRGDSQFLYRKSLTCMIWQDRRLIHFISNYQDPNVVVTGSKRNKDGLALEIPMP
jgi:hypothetical protein